MYIYIYIYIYVYYMLIGRSGVREGERGMSQMRSKADVKTEIAIERFNV